MSKNNYKVLLTSSSKMGPVGKEVIMRKGYARFLYTQHKVLPIARDSKIVDQFIAKTIKLIEILKTVDSIEIERESKALIIKKPITLASVIKLLSKKVHQDLGQFVFKMPNPTDYGTYKLDLFYQNKHIHTVNVIVSGNNENEK